ncbi:MAG: hypothetical protein LBU60_05460 [Clostridiales bacterium]|jgi:hypothetical protein|nr:hypothetical protein [Clostridiales bacterium]
MEIISTLKQADLLDGISLSAEQFYNTTKPCFWRGVVRDERFKQKDSYVTWKIVASSPHTRADNLTALREITIALDIFSKRSFDSEQNHKLLDNIEQSFTQKNFEVEFANEQFESDLGLYHIPMTVYKIY